MYSAKSYFLTKPEYNYLLPVLTTKLLIRGENHYFVDSSDGLSDMLDRLKGLYDYYSPIPASVVYKCFKNSSIAPFRELI